MLQPTVQIQLNDEDLQTMKAELEELRSYKAAACEKQAKEEEAERLRRKKEADRSRMRRADDKVKSDEIKNQQKEVKQHNSDLKKSLRRSNDAVRELFRLRGGKLSGLSAATKTTCLLLAYEEDTTN